MLIQLYEKHFTFNNWYFILLFLLTLFLTSYVKFVYLYIPVRDTVMESSPFILADFFVYNFLLKVIAYSLRFFLITLLISVVLILFNQEVKLKKLLQLIIIAEFVFFLPDMIQILWFFLIESEYSLERYSDYYPLSLYAVMNYDLREGWSGIIFRYLNLFEILYVLVLYYGITYIYNLRSTITNLIILFGYGIFYMLKIIIH